MTTRRSPWRGFLWPLVAVTGVLVLPLAMFVFALWRGSWSIDRDGGPVPEWLPVSTTDLRLRGSDMQLWFSGRCDRAAVERWAQERRIPLKEQGRDDVHVVDLARWPVGGPRPDQTLLMDVEVLLYERRAADGGGISLLYLPASGVFHGDRSWW